MTREAEAHAADDKQRKESVEIRNNVDNMAYSAEKTLRDLGDKVPANIKQEVDAKVAEVRTALQGQDTQRIKSATQELTNTLQKVGSAVYGSQPGAGPQAGQGGPQGPGAGQQQGTEGPDQGTKGPGADQGTVEGEFREV